MSEQQNNICIIGIGNTLRGDDGVGAYVCTEIKTLNLPGVDTMVVQQLTPDLMEDLQQYKHIIITDASYNCKGFAFYPLQADETNAQSSSHAVNASMFYLLFKKIYSKQPTFYICAIEPEDVSIGSGLTTTSQANAEKAIHAITDWIAVGKYRSSF
jgi:hydrogenase maturation protease